jgi:hypothetical protein
MTDLRYSNYAVLSGSIVEGDYVNYFETCSALMILPPMFELNHNIPFNLLATGIFYLAISTILWALFEWHVRTPQQTATFHPMLFIWEAHGCRSFAVECGYTSSMFSRVLELILILYCRQANGLKTQILF